jgi:YVTN family beta-propeller protein
MAELPSGAVTFLFTDIEGSTQLVKALRWRYAEVLNEHQRILRESFAAHGGREIDTQGDAFFVAFGSARAAVLAAVDAQRALLRHSWPDGAAVKVRMGIHTGQASPADGRYTGLAVHRAARICAAAHGGQVLVSQATHTLLEDEEEDIAITFRPLGEHRLKDLARPVSLYQTGAADLPSKFPPLREQAPRAPSWLRRPVVVVLVALALAAVAAAVAVLTLGAGAGGGLSGVDANNVGVIDLKSNRIVAQVPVGIRPGPVATGFGSVWVGNLEDRTLTRVDQAKQAQIATIPLENRTPTAVAAGAGGIWVAHGILGLITRIDPEYNRPGEPISRPAERGSPGGTQAASVDVGGGSVWAVFGNSTLVRINPSSSRLAGRGYAGTAPSGIVYAERSVWVANAGEATVYRFNPATFEQGPSPSLPVTVGARPGAIAYGQGSLWVANTDDGTVSRIDPGSFSVRATISVGRRPSAIAVGGGAAWVANSGDGTVSRIDPKTNTVVGKIRTGKVPAGVAVAGGLVWVTVQAR